MERIGMDISGPYPVSRKGNKMSNGLVLLIYKMGGLHSSENTKSHPCRLYTLNRSISIFGNEISVLIQNFKDLGKAQS